jgi:hypothetical protein
MFLSGSNWGKLWTAFLNIAIRQSTLSGSVYAEENYNNVA